LDHSYSKSPSQVEVQLKEKAEKATSARSSVANVWGGPGFPLVQALLSSPGCPRRLYTKLHKSNNNKDDKEEALDVNVD
jgi:hypothetical protein